MQHDGNVSCTSVSLLLSRRTCQRIGGRDLAAHPTCQVRAIGIARPRRRARFVPRHEHMATCAIRRHAGFGCPDGSPFYIEDYLVRARDNWRPMYSSVFVNIEIVNETLIQIFTERFWMIQIGSQDISE